MLPFITILDHKNEHFWTFVGENVVVFFFFFRPCCVHSLLLLVLMKAYLWLHEKVFRYLGEGIFQIFMLAAGIPLMTLVCTHQGTEDNEGNRFSCA